MPRQRKKFGKKWGQRPGVADFARNLKTVILDRTYGSLLLCCPVFAIGIGLAVTLGTYVATYFWRINTEQLSTLAAAGIVGMILGVLTAKLSRRFGKKHVSMILYGIAMIGICVPVLLGLLGLIERDLDALMPWLIAKNIIV